MAVSPYDETEAYLALILEVVPSIAFNLTRLPCLCIAIVFSSLPQRLT